MKLKIKQIKVGERFRKDFGNLDGLKTSIETYGLIHPPVVEDICNGEFLLLAGERRLRACILLGWDEIPVTLRKDLDPSSRRELELEENLHRKDLDWTEEVQIKLEIDELKRSLYGHATKGQREKAGWSRQDLAESLGESKGKVVQDLALAEFLRKNPELKETFKRLPKTTALRKMKQKEANERAHVFVQSSQKTIEKDFVCGDASTELLGVETESIDLILTDPPYGATRVSGENENAKQSLLQTGDNIAVNELDSLLEDVVPELFRVLKAGRHFYCFIAIEAYDVFHYNFSQAGFVVRTTPIVWAKGRNMTAGTGLNYMRSYELILYGYKPSSNAMELRSYATNCIDVVTFPPTDIATQIQAFEKPIPLLEFFIRQSTFQYEVVLDPFAGSGSTLRAARSQKRNFFGIEKNPDHYARAVELLSKTEV